MNKPMPVEIVTHEDLERFRNRLLQDLRQLLEHVPVKKKELQEGYKTKDARKLLKCSVNTLVSLRVSRKLRVKKIGGSLYYNKEDIQTLLEEGY